MESELQKLASEVFSEMGFESVNFEPFLLKKQKFSSDDDTDYEDQQNKRFKYDPLYVMHENIDEERNVENIDQSLTQTEQMVPDVINTGIPSTSNLSLEYPMSETPTPSEQEDLTCQKIPRSLQFVQSSKSSGQLVHNGYIFNKEKTENDITRWKCIKYRKFKCRGRVHTSGTEVIYDNGQHNHEALASDIQARIVSCTVKETALFSVQSTPPNIDNDFNDKHFIESNFAVPKSIIDEIAITALEHDSFKSSLDLTIHNLQY